MAQVGDTKVLFSDDFKNPLNPGNWSYPTGDASFLGRTQMRDQLSPASGGVLRLNLDTWLDGKAFKGSEVFTNKNFGLKDGGVAFEVRARFKNPVKGAVGGIFPYKYNPSTKLHDEIDWEAIGNDVTAGIQRIQTNVYADDPFGAGKGLFVPVKGSLTDWHTYRIEWTKSSVKWFVDGVLQRTETVKVPKGDMQLHLNIWAPKDDWKQAYSDTLQPAQSAGANKNYNFDISYVKITQLATLYGSAAPNRMNGTDKNDVIHGRAGDDRIDGGDRRDTILGGSGDDRLFGGNGNDKLRAGPGEDILNGKAGSDVLRGGADADVFVFNTALKKEGVDQLRDFKPGEDVIWLHHEIFVGIGKVGELAEEAFRKGSSAKEADDRVIFESATGKLSFDEDGNGEAEAVHFATLRPGAKLGADDFLIV